MKDSYLSKWQQFIKMEDGKRWVVLSFQKHGLKRSTVVTCPKNDASGYLKGGSSCFRSKKIEFVFTGLSFTGSGRWTGGGLFLLSGWMALKHEGSWGRTRWRIRVQVQAGLFCHDQLVLSLPINHCFPFTHLPGSTPVVISGYRGDWLEHTSVSMREVILYLWRGVFWCFAGGKKLLHPGACRAVRVNRLLVVGRQRMAALLLLKGWSSHWRICQKTFIWHL